VTEAFDDERYLTNILLFCPHCNMRSNKIAKKGIKVSNYSLQFFVVVDVSNVVIKQKYVIGCKISLQKKIESLTKSTCSRNEITSLAVKP
jgi:hypothetical protein